MKTRKKPLSIYIHIPFCKKKCLYCDFLSAPACGQERESYVKALLREISVKAEMCCEYEVISVFFGGGTPSLLSKGQMKRIMSALRKGYCLSEAAEITVECNPATADPEKLMVFRECGINRLSIGLQSANDKELKELGRIHTYQQFLVTYEAARNAGFSNINIDIMSALPGQTIESYVDTLYKVISLQPEHISAYSLIIEEGTPFYERYADEKMTGMPSGYPELPDEDTERLMYHKTKTILEKEGYLRYEISNYAKKGYECRHNLTYWTGIEYIGFGLGASSYLGMHRMRNVTDHKVYALAAEYEENIRLSLEERMEEYLFLGLRLKRGVSVTEFEHRFGKDIFLIYGPVIEKNIKERLLVKKKDRLYLSKKGMDVANYVMSQFLLG